jgi:hypothetical protein
MGLVQSAFQMGAGSGRFQTMLMLCLQAVDFVRQRLVEGQSVRYISESVCDHCLAKDTGGSGIGCDNMSMMIVVFKKFTQYDKAHKARMAATSMSGQDLYS